MFSTWRFDEKKSEIQTIRQTTDPILARTHGHVACDRCHEKKMKCSGDKNGCNRCASASVKCEFNRCEAKRRNRSTSSWTPRAIVVDRYCRESSIVSSASSSFSLPSSPPSTATTTTTPCSSSFSSNPKRCKKSTIVSRRRKSAISPAVKIEKRSESPSPIMAPIATPAYTEPCSSLTPAALSDYASSDSLMYSPPPPPTPPPFGLPAQVEHQFFTADHWAYNLSDEAAADLMQATFCAEISSQQTCVSIVSQEGYPPLPKMACVPGPSQGAWQF